MAQIPRWVHTVPGPFGVEVSSLRRPTRARSCGREGAGCDCLPLTDKVKRGWGGVFRTVTDTCRSSLPVSPRYLSRGAWGPLTSSGP